MTNNQLAENSVNQLLNSVRLARDNAERADNRVDHSFYYALTIALEELQERRKADSEPVAWTDEEELRDVNVAGIGYLFGIDREANKFADPRRQIMLYRHAQQPVVLDSGREQFEEWFKFHDDGENSTEKLQRTNGGANYLYPDVDLAWIVWKDSRSAMLQTAPAHLLPDKGHKWSYGLVHPENCQCIECRSARINGVKP